MNSRRVKLVLVVVLVVLAAAVAILAGIGTGASFATDGNLWGDMEIEAVQSKP